MVHLTGADFILIAFCLMLISVPIGLWIFKPKADKKTRRKK